MEEFKDMNGEVVIEIDTFVPTAPAAPGHQHRRIVSLNFPGFETEEGHPGFGMPPEHARELAAALSRAADEAEAS